jgi:arylformamidase
MFGPQGPGGLLLKSTLYHKANQWAAKDLSDLTLDQLANLDGIVVRAPHERALEVGLDQLAGLTLEGKAVLIHTGWASYWRTDQYYENHPYLSEAAAQLLVASGARLVGIDSHNIDDTRTRARPAHTILLGADIPICEHLCNLEKIPDHGFLFHAVPPKIKGFGTFPVRAYATVVS